MLAGKEVRHCPVLCLNSGDDEAFGWLQFSEVMANIPNLLLARWTPRVYFVLAFIFLLAGVLPHPMPSVGSSWFTAIGDFAVSWFFYAAIAHLGLQLVAGPVSFFFRGLVVSLIFLDEVVKL